MTTDFPSRRWLVAILTVAVLLRVLAAFYLGDHAVDLPGTFDQISYHNLALRVLGGHGFSFDQTWWPITPAGAPTAHWSFLYTLYLVAVYAVAGVHPLVARVLQAIVTGLVQPYLAYRLGEATFSRLIGLVAAALTAVYAYFFYSAAALMTEPFFITLVLAGLYLTIVIARRSVGAGRRLPAGQAAWFAVLLGLVLGSAVLLRQLILLLVP